MLNLPYSLEKPSDHIQTKHTGYLRKVYIYIKTSIYLFNDKYILIYIYVYI
jgi:hypothetical protein